MLYVSYDYIKNEPPRCLRVSQTSAKALEQTMVPALQFFRAS